MDTHVKLLRDTAAELLARIDDFLQWRSAQKHRFTEEDYFRFLVPVSKPIERLRTQLRVEEIQTSDIRSLMHGEEDDQQRGVALLKQAIVDGWPLPMVAGVISAMIFPQFDVAMLARIFSKMRDRLAIAIRLMDCEPAKIPAFFAMADLKRMMGCSDSDTVRGYMEKAKLPTAKKGESGFKLNDRQTIKFLESVIEHATRCDFRQCAEMALSKFQKPPKRR